MARNQEKNLTGLNRILIEKRHEVEKKYKLERPRLETLSDPSEIKSWIPQIKSEISYCVQQLSGIRNYPEYKIKEFQDRLERLRNEWKRWVKKCMELEPNTVGIPGEPHGYVSKKSTSNRKRAMQETDWKVRYAEWERTIESSFRNGYQNNFQTNDSFIQEGEVQHDDRPSKVLKLQTPLLDKEETFSSINGNAPQVNAFSEENDKPLEFNFPKAEDNKKETLQLVADYSSSSEDD